MQAARISHICGRIKETGPRIYTQGPVCITRDGKLTYNEFLQSLKFRVGGECTIKHHCMCGIQLCGKNKLECWYMNNSDYSYTIILPVNSYRENINFINHDTCKGDSQKGIIILYPQMMASGSENLLCMVCACRAFFCCFPCMPHLILQGLTEWQPYLPTTHLYSYNNINNGFWHDYS